jgi:hypothetical protein
VVGRLIGAAGVGFGFGLGLSWLLRLGCRLSGRTSCAAADHSTTGDAARIVLRAGNAGTDYCEQIADRQTNRVRDGKDIVFSCCSTGMGTLRPRKRHYS